MWFGIHYIPAEEHESGEAVAIVHVYQRERQFTIGGSPEAVPQILSFLQLSMYDSAVALPRCRSCGTGFDVPDIDGLEAACGSA